MKLFFPCLFCFLTNGTMCNTRKNNMDDIRNHKITVEN